MAIRNDYIAGEAFEADDLNDITTLLKSLGRYNEGDGSDGALNVASGTTTLDAGSSRVLVKNYSSINIASGATLTISNPHDEGTLLVLLCTGDCDIDGKIDLLGMGSLGGTQVSVSAYDDSTDVANGNTATTPFNSFGTRYGAAGGYYVDGVSGEAEGVGAGGSANAINDGSNSLPTSNAGAASGGEKTTVTELLFNYVIAITPGCGGSTGGCAVASTTGETCTATSGAGGRGGGALLVIAGGDLSFTGEIDLSGSNATASTTSRTGGTGVCAAGGAAGGAAGVGLLAAKGDITDSGTKTVTYGTGGTPSDIGSGGSAESTAAANSATGAVETLQIW